MADARFSTTHDPRFKAVPRHVRKVEVDGRFAHMFKDKRFVETPKVDSRGQKLQKGAAREKLKEFYSLDKDASEKKPTKGKKKKKAAKAAAQAEADEDGEEAAAEDGVAAEEDEEECVEEKGSEADAEGSEEEQEDEQDSEDGDAEDAEEEEEEEEDAEGDVENPVWADEQEQVPRGDASKRIAVMGCDWDHVSADDLMVMFKTYLGSKESRKAGGLQATAAVEKVTIYPSQFGLEEMEKEATQGPAIETLAAAAGKAKAAGADEDGGEDNAEHSEALRAYQIKRTKYYWALAEFDSVRTSNWLYDQMDGIEADGICPGTLDLRFVPDELVPPHDPVGSTTAMPKKYQAPTLLNNALGQSKVKCSWDEAPQQRKKDLMRKRFSAKEMADMDLTTYLASSSGEEDEEAASALKKLARGEDGDDSDFFASDGSGDEKDPQFGDMEATFSVKATELEEKLEEKVKKQGGTKVHTLQDDGPQTVWEKYLQKKKDTRRERKQKAKEEKKRRKEGKGEEFEAEDEAGAAGDEGDLAVLAAADMEEEDRGFNARGSQRAAHSGKLERKQKRKALAGGEAAEGGFKVNTEDPRIAAVFANPDFDIDPTNPEFRKTEGMGTVLKKKRQRKVAAAAKPANVAASAPAAPAAAPAATKGEGLGKLQLFGGPRRGEGRADAAAAGTGTSASTPAPAAAAEAAAEAVRPKKKRKKGTA